MKTRIAVAIASLFVASLGTAAFAQSTPQQTPPPATASTSMSGNNMSMSNSKGPMSNSQTEEKIKHELTAHGVTATNVMVNFQDGTATLTGTVFSKADIKKAKSAAMRVRGVKHVDTSGLQAQAKHSSPEASDQGAGL